MLPIPSQPKCLRRYNLRFVTSSVQDKAGASSPDQKQERGTKKDESGEQASGAVGDAVPVPRSGLGTTINPFGAYHVVSSAASYLHSRATAMGVMPFGPGNGVKDDHPAAVTSLVSGASGDGLSVDEASFVATTSSVTSMVAAKEETRQAVADDLNSSRSCPCEWFVCEDDQNSTIYFVVQVPVPLACGPNTHGDSICSFCSLFFLCASESNFCAIVVCFAFCDLRTGLRINCFLAGQPFVRTCQI
jgi:hypothetical protein